MTAKTPQSKRQGFTLVELMIVVAIIAILAAIAIPAYIGYIESARETEALEFLATVSAKQEAYRTRFGRFATASANPTAIPKIGEKKNWDETNAGWIALGIRPKFKFSSFQYETKSGPANVTCSPPSDASKACNADMANRAWFWSIARMEDKIVVHNSERTKPWVVKD